MSLGITTERVEMTERETFQEMCQEGFESWWAGDGHTMARIPQMACSCAWSNSLYRILDATKSVGGPGAFEGAGLGEFVTGHEADFHKWWEKNANLEDDPQKIARLAWFASVDPFIQLLKLPSELIRE